MFRSAVATGEYASSSEVIRGALRDWTYKRTLRQQGVSELRQLWQEALDDKTPGVAADTVLDRLERKYQAIIDQNVFDSSEKAKARRKIIAAGLGLQPYGGMNSHPEPYLTSFGRSVYWTEVQHGCRATDMPFPIL